MTLRRLFIALGILSWAAATAFVLAPVFPYLLYRLSPNTPATLARGLAATTPKIAVPPSPRDPLIELPPQNSQLTKDNTLIIPSIGVSGVIHEGENWEELLRQGVWKAPDFPPPDTGRPVILASHRWGYLDWSNTFRRQNSFYSLPQTKVGDKVEIIWNQRSYTYQIYLAQSGTEITDYSADLILYTCQLWNSPQRIFRYAKRI